MQTYLYFLLVIFQFGELFSDPSDERPDESEIDFKSLVLITKKLGEMCFSEIILNY